VQYNTVVSAGMKILNALEMESGAGWQAQHDCLSILLRLLHPIVPHITHVLWNALAYDADLGPLWEAPWPRIDAAALVPQEVKLALQINGKLRTNLIVPFNLRHEDIEPLALATDAVKKQLEQPGAVLQKIIVVPNRIVNILIKNI
jgi:leucyl-tRNA synthetase